MKHQFSFMSILDREYKTVIIEGREYMAENVLCPELGFYYDNKPKNSEGGDGTLHTHYAIPAIADILPEGWRIMSKNDWDILIKIIGNNPMKLLAKKFGGTDDYGFCILPAAYRSNSGSYFNYRGYYAYFWSSSAYSSTNAWRRYFYYNYATVYRINNNRSYGFSVRCVRDLQ
jgi:uncharacterized protein (TIGR02145 family)